MAGSAALITRLLAAWKRESSATTVILARRLLEQEPTESIVWLILGSALTDLHQYEEALRAVRHHMRLAPKGKLFLSHSAMGNLYRQKGDLRAAERWYRQAVKAKPSTWRWNLLGDCILRQGRLVEAKRAFRNGVKRGEHSVDESHLNLGLIARAEGDFAEAERQLLAALRIDPKYKYANLVLGDVRRAVKEGAVQRP